MWLSLENDKIARITYGKTDNFSIESWKVQIMS